jgi:hypothetical protein
LTSTVTQGEGLDEFLHSLYGQRVVRLLKVRCMDQSPLELSDVAPPETTRFGLGFLGGLPQSPGFLRTHPLIRQEAVCLTPLIV